MKKFAICFLLFAICACGFSPMYSGAQNTDVYVAPISGINGIDLRNALNAKFGGRRDANAKFTLNVKLEEPVTKFKAIQSTGDATLQEVQLRASYVLKMGDRQIAQGFESASESYAFVRYLVAANALYNNTLQNTINVLSEKIGTRVVAETSNIE